MLTMRRTIGDDALLSETLQEYVMLYTFSLYHTQRVSKNHGCGIQSLL